MEKTLLGMSEAWAASYKDFEASGKKNKKSPPEKFKKHRSPGRCRVCAGRAAAAAQAIAYLSQMYFLLQTVRRRNLVHSVEKASCCFARRPVYLLLKI